MKIAVTGGNGDMGRNLIPYLLEQNHTVVSIDRALPTPARGPGVNFIVADTRDFGQFVAGLRKVAIKPKCWRVGIFGNFAQRSEEHTSELQSQ